MTKYLSLKDLAANAKDAILFISDLHLDSEQPQITELFLEFLNQCATQANSLYILGDLFEAYIGDDDSNELFNTIKTAIKKISNKVHIYFLPGNRDFLVSKKFAQQTGCKILPDPTLIHLYNKTILLTHGDILCMADKRHQYFRKISRLQLIKKIFTLLPLNYRKNLANKMRSISKKHTVNLSMYQMDVTPDEVNKMLRDYATQTMIHGHTHQPAIHEFKLDNKKMQRIVLGAWHKEGNVLVWKKNNEPELINFL